MRDQVALMRALEKQNKAMRWQVLPNGAQGEAADGDGLTVTLTAPGEWQAVRVVSGATYTATAAAPLLAAMKTALAALEAAETAP